MSSKNEKEQFPGYPHYAAKEDIMRPVNSNGRAPLADEKEQAEPVAGKVANSSDPLLVPGTDADVTPEELKLLVALDEELDTQDNRNLKAIMLDNTDDDGDVLNEADAPEASLTGDDLDLPDVDKDDEENDYFSLGGDTNDALDEDKED